MSETRSLTRDETARLLREALASQFPGIRFSVRRRRLAGADGLVVRWSDGPTPTEVETLVHLYTAATFDPTSGNVTLHDSLLCRPDGRFPEAVRFGADLVLSVRRLSRPARAAIRSQCEGCLGAPLDERRRDHRRLHHQARAVVAFDQEGVPCSSLAAALRRRSGGTLPPLRVGSRQGEPGRIRERA